MKEIRVTSDYPLPEPVPGYITVLELSLSGSYVTSYLICALLIIRMRRFKPEVSTVINISVFLTSFIVKLLLEINLALNPEFFRTKTGLWFNVVEYLVNNAVILNLYYFTYTMMSVWDTLESMTPEDYKKKSKLTTIMLTINVTLHGTLVIGAAALFMYLLPNGNTTKVDKCAELEKIGPDLILNGYHLYLFILQVVVNLCDIFVVTLFLRFFKYFAIKKLNAMHRAGQ